MPLGNAGQYGVGSVSSPNTSFPLAYSPTTALAPITVSATDYGIVGTTTADQTGKIVNMIAALTAQQFGGTILWPAGDIYFTGPIDWSGCGAPSSAGWYQSNSITYSFVTPPSFKGAGPGATRFRMLNSPTTNCTGMIWGYTPAQTALGIGKMWRVNLEDVDFYGPGTTGYTTTLNTATGTGTTVVVTGTPCSVGDAVALTNGARRQWFTVQAVSGTTNQTLTLDTRQAILSNFPTAGTVVTGFKQTTLLQFGGSQSAYSIDCENFTMNRVGIYNAFTGMGLSNVTALKAKDCTIRNCVQMMACVFNVNLLVLDGIYAGSDRGPVTATCTNSSATITGLSGPVAVGEKINMIPNAAGTLNFPEHTFVIATSGTTATLNNAYTGTTGTQTLYPVCGVLLCAGQGGTAFLSQYPGDIYTTFTDNALINPLCGRLERLIDNCDTSGGVTNVYNGYIEGCHRILTNGCLGGAGSGGLYQFDNVFVQAANQMIAPAIEDFLGGGVRLDILVSSAQTGYFPLVQTYSNNGRINLRQGWSWTNASTASLAYLQTSPAIVNLSTQDTSTSLAIPAGSQWTYNTGPFGMVDSVGTTIVNTNFSGALNWNWPGISTLVVTLTGNLTAGSIVYGVPAMGYKLTIYLIQNATGGFTVTLGSSFVTAAGGSLGTIAAGTANQKLIMQFISDGTSLVLQGSQSPAFIA